MAGCGTRSLSIGVSTLIRSRKNMPTSLTFKKPSFVLVCGRKKDYHVEEKTGQRIQGGWDFYHPFHHHLLRNLLRLRSREDR